MSYAYGAHEKTYASFNKIYFSSNPSSSKKPFCLELPLSDACVIASLAFPSAPSASHHFGEGLGLNTPPPNIPVLEVNANVELEWMSIQSLFIPIFPPSVCLMVEICLYEVSCKSATLYKQVIKWWAFVMKKKRGCLGDRGNFVAWEPGEAFVEWLESDFAELNAMKWLP